MIIIERKINMQPSVLAFGEILFDVFDGQACIGGASFNFAAHFSRLGGESYMASAVGADEMGASAMRYADNYKIHKDYIAVLPDKSTGYCNVTLENGHPCYELVRNVAYDAIPMIPVERSFDAIYYGTLAQRDSRSAETLSLLLRNVRHKHAFFDINIRQDFYTQQIIELGLKNATILKFSREESFVFGDYASLEELCRRLHKKAPGLKIIIVTLDADGAMIYSCGKDAFYYSRKPQAVVVSTVGAGDSFSAAFMYNYIKGECIETCIEAAIALSERIVSQKGAV